jgi:hypothetical protein
LQKICRDSQGRVRIETTPVQTGGSARHHPPTSVQIEDPSANVVYFFNSGNHIAHKQPFYPTPSRPQTPEPESPAPLPQNLDGHTDSPNSLGDQEINGIAAIGTRITHTIPAGGIGNEQPIIIPEEKWYSPELSLVVMTKTVDPLGGDTVREIKNLSREEPDPSLFQVPSDYTTEEMAVQPALQPKQ